MAATGASGCSVGVAVGAGVSSAARGVGETTGVAGVARMMPARVGNGVGVLLGSANTAEGMVVETVACAADGGRTSSITRAINAAMR